MDWKVFVTSRAREDLAEIVAYVARDNPRAAEGLGQALLFRLDSLGAQPRLGTVVANHKNIRALLHRKYYIVYRYDEGARSLVVLRFWHSARDLGLLKTREPTDPAA